MHVRHPETVGGKLAPNLPAEEHAVRFAGEPQRMKRLAYQGLDDGGARRRRIVEHDAVACDAAEFTNALPPSRCVHQDAQAHRDVERPIAELDLVSITNLEIDAGRMRVHGA